jgi:ABC-type branched-subunit amino acid transport system substrate-binding protein/transposase
MTFFLKPFIFLFFTSCFIFYEKEIRIKEEGKGFYLEKGIEKLKEKNYKEALNFFNKAKENGEEPYLTQFYLFYTNYLLKDYENAIREGNRFLIFFPSGKLIDKVFYLMGICYEKEKFYVRAVGNFLNAFKKTDDDYIKKNSRKKFEELINKLQLQEIKSILEDAKHTELYEICIYYAFLNSLKEGKEVERDSFYLKLKEIGGKYFREAEKILKKEKKEIKEYKKNVLLLIPLSGEFGEYGKEFLNGFKLIFEGNKFIEIFDTKSDPVYLYEEIKKIKEFSYIIIGPLSTKCALSIFPFLSEKEVIVISPTASDIRIGIKGDNIFAFNEGIYYEIKKISEFIIKNGYRKIGIIYAETKEEETAKDVLIENLNKRDFFVVSYSPDSSDFQDYIKKIKNYSPEIIVLLPSEEKDGVSMISQMKFLKISIPIISIHYLLRENVIKILGEQLKNVYITGSYPFPSLNFLFDEFNEKYSKVYSNPPTSVAMRGYETALILKEIILYGITDFYRIRDFLNLKGFLKGLNDIYTWNEEIIKIYEFDGKEFKEVIR